MIYAAIIIVSLALALAIVLRRLPVAIDGAINEQPSAPVKRPPTVAPSTNRQPVNKTISTGLSSIVWPRLKLKLSAVRQTLISIANHLKKLKPKPKSTRPPVVNSAGQNPNTFWSKPANNQPVDLPMNEPVVPRSVLEQKPTEFAEEIIPPRPSSPAAPLKQRGRNKFQEAEDAFSIRDYKRAERLYLKLATEEPKNPKVYSRLGVIYLALQAYEDARDALQAAIKLEPSISTRHFNLALAYINLGSKSKAIAAMEAALKYDPSNRKYRKMLDDIIAGRV